MENSTLYKFIKIVPKRKYLVMSNERWDNKFIGIYELELNGSNLFIESSDSSECLQYVPQEITPLLDKDFNSVGVNHVLFVLPAYSQNDRRINLATIKQSDTYIFYMRDANLEKVI
jgi:hypothetical protein